MPASIISGGYRKCHLEVVPELRPEVAEEVVDELISLGCIDTRVGGIRPDRDFDVAEITSPQPPPARDQTAQQFGSVHHLRSCPYHDYLAIRSGADSGTAKLGLVDIGSGASKRSISDISASKCSVVGIGSSYAGCSTSRRGIGDIGSGAECSIGGIGSVAKCNLGGIDRGAYRRAIGGIGVLVYPIGGASEHSIGGISSSDFSTSGIGSSYAGCGTFRHGCDNFSSWSSAGNAPRRDLSTIAGLSGVGGPSRKWIGGFDGQTGNDVSRHWMGSTYVRRGASS
ncbi:hypothetical protein PF011_g10891 [Phytophthora fragariae]|uniref:Uncharacterized protein n=3 Tax=Phytophthora fragariae TaxID=53985 RepID=A0A6A3EWY9_9STRA|nr:hypothetical protein PF009_g13218 [Phytophthora fragariae]KAE9007983.1 hypothetical protein PF011_g10891 [Phytophthora fragariae]